MAARPTARAISKLPLALRQLHMTGPATFPSAILTETRTHEPLKDTSKRPQTSSSSSEPAPVVREFNTSRALKAVGDTSTIDFAYLPEQDPEAGDGEKTARVPLLLNTMYSGANARAMHEETPEATLRPLINLLSASGTHIHAPSAMSEVSDNNAVLFEGISSDAPPPEEAKEESSAFKQFFNDLVDDAFGSNKSGAA